MNNFMNSLTAKIIALVLSVFMISYIAYQAYIVFYDPYKTEIVKIGTYSEKIDLDGFFIKGEKLIKQDIKGTISYNYKNAEKVAKDAVIATVYEKESDLYNLKETERLNKELKVLQESKDKESVKGLKVDLVEQEIAALQNKLIKAVDNQDFSDLNDIYIELMSNINKLNLYIKNDVSYEETTVNLQKTINDLNSKIDAPTANIKTDISGAFSNNTDGYEEILTPDIIKNLTVSKVEDIIKNKEKNMTVDPKTIGKIQTDSTWYFISVLSNEDAAKFKVGSELSIRFNSKSTKKILTTVANIITEAENDKSVLILQSSFLDEDIISMRFEHPQIVLKEYSGIVVPKEAIRIENYTDENGNTTSKKGVYVMIGKSVRFKPVDPIFEDKNILISKENESTNYLTVYDQVIVKGKDLNNVSK